MASLGVFVVVSPTSLSALSSLFFLPSNRAPAVASHVILQSLILFNCVIRAKVVIHLWQLILPLVCRTLLVFSNPRFISPISTYLTVHPPSHESPNPPSSTSRPSGAALGDRTLYIASVSTQDQQTKMDVVDRDMERAEVQATRTWSQTSKDRRSVRSHESQQSGISSTSSSSGAPSMGRIATAGHGSAADVVARTRTHPIEDLRTVTHRLQHSQTVGASVKSRSELKPLPEFGGGKPYPPMLPAQEEYVVEFDGKDDPMHPQNWPFKRK